MGSTSRVVLEHTTFSLEGGDDDEKQPLLGVVADAALGAEGLGTGEEEEEGGQAQHLGEGGAEGTARKSYHL